VHPDYAEFKGRAYSRIDPSFGRYFESRRPASIRLDEIRWGGVRRDGIPPLDHPEPVAASDASYLADSDLVFGLTHGGEARAYPRRILGWHELIRDRVGGEELTGVYCTLCGTMIVYRAPPALTPPPVLGTSGFLYRSNKLMVDRATESLWSTFSGLPVIGPLAAPGRSGALIPLPVVTTTWGEWRRRHPTTRTLSLRTGFERDYREGAAYREYFATDRLMFGVPRLDDRLSNKAEVLGLRFGGREDRAVAIAAELLRRRPLFQAAHGGTPFVVLTDASGANRVYARGARVFARWDGGATLVDEEDRSCAVEESRLVCGEEELPRLAAHRAFWFGWYAAFPDTELVR
jgi:hypothetical protein